MAGITGLGTTYNLPNYTGILYGLTPQDTKFFSAIGGLSGGGQTTSKDFEWENYDLRNAAQNVALEGATAPTAQERVRGTVNNLTQIHQEKVSVSYTKQAAVGQTNGIGNTAVNPITSELDWQTEQMLKQMTRDINWSFLNGAYNAPSDNTTTRKTRGLLAAITTNLTANSGVTYTGASAATDTITVTHALSVNDKVIFTDVGASTTIVPGRVYFVQSVSTTVSFKVAATLGGSAITVGTATVSLRRPWTTTLTTTHISSLLQGVFDNGGISESDTATLICNSTQKLAISAAYATSYGKYVESSRNIAGVNVTTIETDFGTLNVMLERMMPQDTICVASLEQCKPVFLETPGKGHFFAEPLAKTGASDDVQLYGEVGLAYGNEKAHGLVTGLAV